MLFLLILVLIFGIAYAAYLPFSSIEAAWMAKLTQPSFALPGWMCGIAWGVMYLLMTVAVWLVLKQKENYPVAPALGVFILQFCVNILWGPVIVKSQNFNLAMVYVCVLFVLVIWNMIAFWEVSDTAGMLFIPYAVWVAYTLGMQALIWQKNG